jgi:hypothetical protein
MEERFERVRRAQLEFQPVRAIARKTDLAEDWASRAVRLMGERRYKEAEQIAKQTIRPVAGAACFPVYGLCWVPLRKLKDAQEV